MNKAAIERNNNYRNTIVVSYVKIEIETASTNEFGVDQETAQLRASGEGNLHVRMIGNTTCNRRDTIHSIFTVNVHLQSGI